MTKTLHSLAFKLGLAIFIVASISFSGLGIYYTQLFSKQIDEQFITQARIPGRLMNQQALPYSAVRDQKTMSDLVGEQVLCASVSRANGVIHYCMNPELEGKTLNCIGKQITDDSISETAFITQSDDGEIYLSSSTPLFADGKYLGMLHQKIDTSRTLSEKKWITSVFVTGDLLCILLTTLVGAFLVRRLTMPRIIASIDCLQTVADGDYSARITNIKVKDELGLLEEGINTTIQCLDERQAEEREERHHDKRTANLLDSARHSEPAEKSIGRGQRSTGNGRQRHDAGRHRAGLYGGVCSRRRGYDLAGRRCGVWDSDLGCRHDAYLCRWLFRQYHTRERR